MSNYVISLTENELKVSKHNYKSVESASTEVSAAVTNGSKIQDTNLFTRAFTELVSGFVSEKSDKNSTVTFLIEPQDVHLRFIITAKSDENTDEFIVAKAREALEGVDFESLYFSYQKIAPFVYQFVAINKSHINDLLEVSNTLGLQLQAVVPWVMLLPRFVGGNKPCIFMSKTGKKQVITLCDLNGVYFSELYSEDKDIEELQKLVWDLSIYKRSNPISKVYTLGGGVFSLNPKYAVSELSVEGTEQHPGFDTHFIYRQVIEQNAQCLQSQVNLLNLLPLPVATKKSSLVYVGAFVGALLVIGSVFGFVVFRNEGGAGEEDKSKVASKVEEPTVLSKKEESKKTTEVQEEDVEEEVELAKEDLKIRIENGAGIPGIAASTQEYLEGFGYTVTEVDNAEEQDRDTTLVKFKTGKLEFKDLLLGDMKEEYDVEFEDGLEDDAEHDVLIIVGLN